MPDTRCLSRWLILVFLLGGALPAHALQPPERVIAASGTVEALFTPGDDIGARLVALIDAARQQIRVQAFSFTHRAVADALIRARRRGVDVQMVVDAEQAERIRTSLVDDLARALPVYVDSAHSSAHDKVMLIDPGTPQAALVTGSANFTHAAQYKNAENLLILRGNPALIDAYLRNWLRHREHAVIRR